MILKGKLKRYRPACNIIPLTLYSRLLEENAELQEKNRQLQAELNQEKQKNRTLQIQNAQQQKDMETMQKKYSHIEQENGKLNEKNKILLSTVDKLTAENLKLRRNNFGQSAERMDAVHHEQSNTTALPEGTASSTDNNTAESEMAEGSQKDKGASGKTSGGKEHSQKAHRPDSEPWEKVTRPNNIRKQMADNLPTVHHYPLSQELIRRLDAYYGEGQWRMLEWEGTQHLVHIPEMYVNQIDYVPVICLKDGTPARPFTEHPDEFPTSILPHSVLSSSEFANIVHKKIAMGIPLYRQEQDMVQMLGVHLGRQDMAKWMIRAGQQGFLQVYNYLIRQEQACKYHNIDETFLQVLLDNRAASTKSYLWTHRTGELANPDHPIVVFIYEPTRAAEHLRKYFSEDIASIISCDHYIAYETLEKERNNVHIALCWMHVRRRFFYAFDLVANIQGLSEESIRESLEAKLLMKIGRIYQEEMKLKKLQPAERKIGRDQKVRPLVQAFFSALHEMNLDDPAYSNILRDAVRYALDGEEKLSRFLEDPCIPIDNGSAERIIRKVASGRRAWLFCDTPEGAKALALFYSLVATAQLNNANDYYYIKYLCEHIPGGLLGPIRQLSDKELESLMPWSEEYKAYEKHEIDTRYNAITLGNDMSRPTKENILEIRRQIAEEDSASEAEEQSSSSSTSAAADPDLNRCSSKAANYRNADMSPADGKDPCDPNSPPCRNELVEIPGSSTSSSPIERVKRQKTSPAAFKEGFPPGTLCQREERKTG